MGTVLLTDEVNQRTCHDDSFVSNTLRVTVGLFHHLGSGFQPADWLSDIWRLRPRLLKVYASSLILS